MTVPIIALPPASGPPLTRVSPASPYAPGCQSRAQGGTLYVNAEVEPHLAVAPSDANRLVGVWQQDRWSSGGAQALATAVSTDGGRSWKTVPPPPFSRCAGGTAANQADYDRASDAWVSIAPNGIVHQVALAFTGDVLKSGSASAILASRSADGGASWSSPAVLIADGAGFFNDKESITADPVNAGYVYVVWDRLSATGSGPTMFARSLDDGASWQAARVVYDPGGQNQTIGNLLRVLPDGTLVLLFTEIDQDASGNPTAFYAALRSTDRGLSWSAPIRIASAAAVGARDPQSGHAIRDGSNLIAAAVGGDGRLAAVWQDARLGSGGVDAIAYSSSTDGGLTWTTPVRVNGVPGVAAFTPSVAIDAQNRVAVSYYDLRDDTNDPNTLGAGSWLTVSADGVHWTERRTSGAFDLARAPDAGGYFLGDYQGFVVVGGNALSLFTTTTGDDANRTDVFALLLPVVPAAGSGSAVTAKAGTVALAEPDAALRARVAENLRRQWLEERGPRRARVRVRR